jgi:Ca2+-binding RTX toxin-like protein
MKSDSSKGKTAQEQPGNAAQPTSASSVKGSEQARQDATRANMPEIDTGEMSGPGVNVAGAAATMAVLSGLLRPDEAEAQVLENADTQAGPEGGAAEAATAAVVAPIQPIADASDTVPPTDSAVTPPTAGTTISAAEGAVGTVPDSIIPDAPVVSQPFALDQRDVAQEATTVSQPDTPRAKREAEAPDLPYEGASQPEKAAPEVSTPISEPDEPIITVTSILTEGEGAAPTIATINGADLDQPGVTYQIVDANGVPFDHPMFEIIGNDIVLKPGATADFEEAAFHDVTIIAVNEAGQSEPEVVTIDVADVAETITLGDSGETFADTGVAETAVIGGAGNDVITGSTGVDNLTGVGGDDTIDGGAGADIANWSSDLADYAVSYDAGSSTFTITDNSGSDGSDTVTGIETFTFNGVDYSAADLEHEAALQANTAPEAVSVASGGEMRENAGEGTVVATLTSTDADGDALTYKITDADGNVVTDSNFEIVGNEILVAPGADVNFEEAASHNLYVVANDGLEGSVPQQVTVTVDDVAETIILGDGGATFIDTDTAEISIIGGAGDDIISNAGIDSWSNGVQIGTTGIFRPIAVLQYGATVTGGAGDDVITGYSRSLDTAAWEGDLSDFSVVYDASTRVFTITDRSTVGLDEGSDTVTSVERFMFNGTSYRSFDMRAEATRQAEAAPDPDSTSSGGSDTNPTVTSPLVEDNPDYDTGYNEAAAFDGDGTSNAFWGDGSDEVFYGRGGDDQMGGSGGADIFYGGSGNDSIFASDGDDTAYGGAGNDNITGDAGSDTLHGDAGDDKIYGGEGVDTLYGGSGHDEIHGNAGDDILYGGAGNDLMYGQDGSDILIGGSGDDTMAGVAGDDLYQIGAMQGNDSIIETGGWTDLIDLQGVGGVQSVSGNTVDGDGWTLVISSGSVTGQSADRLDLSEQAHGVLTFDTGGTIDFTGIERITW